MYSTGMKLTNGVQVHDEPNKSTILRHDTDCCCSCSCSFLNICTIPHTHSHSNEHTNAHTHARTQAFNTGIYTCFLLKRDICSFVVGAAAADAQVFAKDG